MSIIYDALKKLEVSANKAPAKLEQKSKPNFKLYLIYIFVAGFGFLIANIFLGLLTRPLKTNTDTAAKKETLPEKIQVAEPPEAVADKNTTIKEAELVVVPAETKKSPNFSFTLNGVFFSEAQGCALINNQIVKEGDIISGCVVKRIGLDEVELEYEGSTIKLTPNK